MNDTIVTTTVNSVNGATDLSKLMGSCALVFGILLLILSSLVVAGLQKCELKFSTCVIMSGQAITSIVAVVTDIFFIAMVDYNPAINIPIEIELIFSWITVVYIYSSHALCTCLAINRFVYIVYPTKAEEILSTKFLFGLATFWALFTLPWSFSTLFYGNHFLFSHVFYKWGYTDTNGVVQSRWALGLTTSVNLFSWVLCGIIFYTLISRKAKIAHHSNETGQASVPIVSKKELNILFQAVVRNVCWILSAANVFIYSNYLPYRSIAWLPYVLEALKYIYVAMDPLVAFLFMGRLRQEIYKLIKITTVKVGLVHSSTSNSTNAN